MSGTSSLLSWRLCSRRLCRCLCRLHCLRSLTVLRRLQLIELLLQLLLPICLGLQRPLQVVESP